MPPGVSCPAWYRLVFVDTMANRDHNKSRSPVNAIRRDAGRLSQASTVAALSQPDALMLTPTPARGDFHSEWPPDSQQPSGTSSQVFGTPVSQSPFAHLGGPTYRGDPPTPAPAPVSGPSPTIHLVNTDPFARARIAAVQSRVAAPVVSDPRPPPPVPAFSPFRDGHYWCSKCPRKGFTTIPGLMRHITHQHAGSTVDEATCSLFTAIERVTCTAPACAGLRRVGARVCNRCGQASQARPPRVGDIIMGPLGAPVSGEDTTMVDADVNVTPSLTVDLPPVDLPGDFTQRIRALLSNTILHVPASCRLRMISAVAQCWNGMAQGRDDYAGSLEAPTLSSAPGLECGHRGSEASHSLGGAALRDASATC